QCTKADDGIYTHAQQLGQTVDNGAKAIVSADCNQEGEDTGREVVHQHLQSLSCPRHEEIVDQLDQVASERPHDHCAKQHRVLRICCDDPHRCRRTDHTATEIVYETTAGKCDQ